MRQEEGGRERGQAGIGDCIRYYHRIKRRHRKINAINEV
jgi:hypothetical protein